MSDDVNTLFQKEIVYKPELSGECKEVKNINYSAKDENLLCDLYLPTKIIEESNFPVMILVHGEAPFTSMKDAGQYRSLARIVADSGITTVTFNHRMVSNGNTIEDVLGDIKDLHQFIINKAVEYNIDITRIGFWSFSAGMPFGFYHALNCLVENVKCIIGYYGIGDFETLINLVPNEINRNIVLPKIVNKNASRTPILIIRAGLDNQELNKSLEKLVLALLSENANIIFYNHPTGHHAFDILDNNQISIETIQKTISFTKKYLI